jgi:hypothetical protein
MESLYASSIWRVQNLGMKDNITVVLKSVLPNMKPGKWKFSVVYTKMKSLFGVYDFSISNKV